MLNSASSKKGGFTGKQIELAQRITGKKQWKRHIIGMYVKDEDWELFVSLVKKPKFGKMPILNKFPRDKGGDWSWKPKEKDIPKIKKLGANEKKRQKVRQKYDPEFYKSKEWLDLRMRVLSKYDYACMSCGRNYRDHSVIIHVDHIKPRSRHPELSLNFDNLQVLCEDCNIGKSSKYSFDLRPKIDLNLNEHEKETVQEIKRLISYGCKSCDLIVRKDGQDYGFEVDWLKDLINKYIIE